MDAPYDCDHFHCVRISLIRTF
ncbi:hypothetical protein DSM3645_03063 [Blastopirellula marina DSM 3645]|uniref:Uncharacterized protein n=1 Tax=Blastopirellula marina DSM 3645 TaxID=314230 RepID=A3ZVS6_9BACT|nr:hypothetical protein DSM3645_03063 [Blastopirellula marina DSM 3645]